MTTQTILKIDASMRKDGSYSRQLTSALVDQLQQKTPGASVVTRDLSDTAIPYVNEEWIGANFTPDESRTTAQQAELSLSDALVEELKAADVIVIGVPVYNFSIPAALKAWVDMIARARLTFKYTENGPVGLLAGKKAILAVASGGTEVGSDIDFATPYLRHILGFVGITDVTTVSADLLMADAGRFETALESIRAA